jgi:hypothetical protein
MTTNDTEERLVAKIEQESRRLHEEIKRVEERFSGIYLYEAPARKFFGALIVALLLLILWRAW